jgi:hypothetical protein
VREVAGSNPVSPTMKYLEHSRDCKHPGEACPGGFRLMADGGPECTNTLVRSDMLTWLEAAIYYGETLNCLTVARAPEKNDFNTVD